MAQHEGVPEGQPAPRAPRRAMSASAGAAPSGSSPRPSRPRRPARHPFTQSLMWTGAATLLPGSGLWRTRHRRLGIAVSVVFVGAVMGLATKVLLDLGGSAGIAVRPRLLAMVSFALMALALAWVGNIVATHLLTRPERLTRAQRGVGGIAVGVLSFAISAPLTVGAAYSQQQASLVKSIFKESGQTKSQTRPTLAAGNDVWADKPRLNILLLGGDNSAERDAKQKDLGIRTDTMMMASINTDTGATTIIQLPRNLEAFPFPQGSPLAQAYPDGYWDGVDNENPEFELNSVWDNVPANHPELFTNTDYKGADALKVAVEGITGLKPDYFVLLSIDGLQQLIDAMGGVTVNVNGYIPVAQRSEDVPRGIPPKGGYIGPGENRKLNGYYAMWFARSRSQSEDPDRMARQSCVVKSVIDQANPANLLTHYEAIANAGKDALLTDIPQEVAPAMIDLALRMQGGTTRRVLFGYPTTTLPNGEKFKPWDPDIEQMRAMIQAGIDAADGVQPSPSTKPSAAASSSASKPKASSTPSPKATSASGSATPDAKPASDLKDACAWNPELAEQAKQNPPPDLGVNGVH